MFGFLFVFSFSIRQTMLATLRVIPLLFSAFVSLSEARHFQPKIVGGYDLTIEEAPYALIFEYNNNALCGAAILTNKYAITSGNCVEGFSDDEYNNAIRLRSGSTRQGTDGATHKVVNYTLHPQYVGVTNEFDVAIVEVDEPFQYGEATQPISLASGLPLPPTNFTVAGWGYTSANGGGGDNLQGVGLLVISKVACAQAVMDYMDITETMFCGYTDNAGPCFRDFGAPATVNDTLIGVFSALIGCAREASPAVLTNTNHPNIRSWILELTGV